MEYDVISNYRVSAALQKERHPVKASRRDFLKKIDFKKKVLRCLIPQSSAMTAPFTREPFDISPHRGESPFTREPNLIPQSTHFVRSQFPLQGSLIRGARCISQSPVRQRDFNTLSKYSQTPSKLRFISLLGILTTVSPFCSRNFVLSASYLIPLSS